MKIAGIPAGLTLATMVIVLATGCGADKEAVPATPSEDLASVAPTGKLQAGVRPVAYRLDLLLDPRRDDFSGTVAIDVQLDAPTDRIWLHGKDLDVTEVTGSTDSGIKLSGSYTEVLASGVAAVVFEEKLPAGKVTLQLRYGTDFDRNLAGLFKVVEQDASYVLAKSESIQARSYMPGFDEPGLKATFDISLTIPNGHVAIGNSPELERQPVDDDLQRITFATTPPMSTYLLSLAVGPFDIVERDAIPPNEFREHAVPLRGIARKGRGGDMNVVLDITPRMIEIFEQELQRPYPFEKLDIVSAPQWPSGATELSAAITYREQLVLLGDSPAEGARLRLLDVHAHEIAHMWFGNQVTPPWWDDLWLKEGFATWASPLVLTRLEPEGGHELNAAQESLDAMRQDSLASTRAIRESISHNEEIRNAYDSITYSKSLGVIHMVDSYFGSDTFRPALGRYIETFAGSVADSPDFYQVIGNETEVSAISDTFQSFVEQRGVPLLEVALQCDAGTVPTLSIQQSRYKALGSPIEQAGERWTIPICIRSADTRQCFMMTQVSETLELGDAECPRWVLPNAGGSGYFRWSLDGASWAALIEDFHLLTPVEALSAIDSAFASFEAGTLDESNLLALVAASANRPERQVITAPLSTLRKYVSQYLSVTDRQKFLEFARNLYQLTVERSANSNDGDAQLLYAELIRFMALTALDPDARSYLLDSAHAFTGFNTDRKEDALSSDLYRSALLVAVQDSDADFLQHLIDFRIELDDPLFASASADAIGGISNPDLLGVVHELVLGDSLGSREVFGLVGQALAEPALRDQHWLWFRENFATVADKIPTQWRRYMPAVAAQFCAPLKLDELKAIFGQHGDLIAGYQKNLDQAEERIELCIAQRGLGEKLADALKAR